jgi:YidC/Oxa1 family membrane protein insertase
MDIKRVILLAALFVVGYFLMLTWNRDYQQPNVSITAKPAETTQTNAASKDLPTAPAATEPQSGSQDMPTSVPGTKSTPSTANQHLVHVRTDVLDAYIDLKGGDLVYASLPGYKQQLNEPQPFVLLQQSQEHTYILQSGLIGKDGPDASSAGRPLYSVAKTDYKLAASQQKLKVTLELKQPDGVMISKQFTFSRGQYLVDVSYQIDNKSQQTWSGNFFAQIKRDGLADPSNNSFAVHTFLGGALSSPQEHYQKIKLDKFGEVKYNQQGVTGGWAAFLQHYFVSAWIPPQNSRNNFSTRKDGKFYYIGYISPAVSVAAGQSKTLDNHLYVGPKLQESLEAAAPYLDLTIDYGWLWFISKYLFVLLNFFHSIFGNWGIAIIALTILVKAIFYPLSASSYKSMANMRRLQPKLQSLKERHGSDRQAMSRAMMELYKKERINPLGGCLPILVQMPVFISLYWTLQESVELRQAPFFLWIHDLSVMDPYFILPLIMGATMFIQQLLNPTPMDPTQAKVMKMMPIIFTFFFLWFPAGLVIYWIVNNLLSILQQWYVTSRIQAKYAVATVAKPAKTKK